MIPDLRRRSHDPELIDEPGQDPEGIVRMHAELGAINRWLGGHGASLTGIEELAERERKLSILDAGSGGGDTAAAIEAWARRGRRRVRIVALDLNPISCADARRRTTRRTLPVAGDAFALPFADRVFDVAHAALFLHHFDDERLIRLVRELARVARRGIVVNDLHRHWFAWASIRALTRVFSRSPLIRHDAPLSVRRGFTAGELARVFRRAGVPTRRISWRWAFRYVVTAGPGGSESR